MSNTVDYLLKCTMETLRGKLRSSRHPAVLRKALTDAKEDLVQLVELSAMLSRDPPASLKTRLQSVNSMLAMSDNALRGAAATF